MNNESKRQRRANPMRVRNPDLDRVYVVKPAFADPEVQRAVSEASIVALIRETYMAETQQTSVSSPIVCDDSVSHS